MTVLLLTKTCLKCKAVKSLEDFGCNKARSDGHHYYCRLCANAISHTRMTVAEAREKHKAANRVCRQQERSTPEGREKVNTASRIARRITQATGEGREKHNATARKYRATPEGREKSNAAVCALRATPEGREKANAANRAQRATPEGRKKANVSCLAWQKNNPDKATANTMKRHAAKKKRLPVWANLEAIAKFYVDAKNLTQQTGVKHHVDHKIPLQGRLVSGLHVENNLQVLTASANEQKSNQWEVS